MSGGPRLRHSVRVVLLDEDDRLLLFAGEQPDTGARFWFPPGGGLEEGEDVSAAAARELAEEAGIVGVALGPEVWRRRHVFPWRGVEWDQRERWLLARVRHFEPAGQAMSAEEKADLKAWQWWTVDELEAADDDLVPRDLAARLRELLANGPPSAPIDVGV